MGFEACPPSSLMASWPRAVQDVVLMRTFCARRSLDHARLAPKIAADVRSALSLRTVNSHRAASHCDISDAPIEFVYRNICKIFLQCLPRVAFCQIHRHSEWPHG